MKKCCLIWLILAIFCQITAAQQTFYVSSGADSGEGSLRNILQQASSYDTIRFQPGIDTVFLTSGELLIDKSISMEGNENLTFIKRGGSAPQFRLFRIESENTVKVYYKKMGFMGGYAPDGDQVNINGYDGGAILAMDTLHYISLDCCELINNRSGNGINDSWGFDFAGNGGHGGAIFSNSRLALENCILRNNFCGTGGSRHEIAWDWYILHGKDGGKGGAIYATTGMELENCVFEANRAGNGRSAIGSGSDYVDAIAGRGGDGGAVFLNGDSLSISECMFTSNQAGTAGSAQSNCGASCKPGGCGGAVFAESSSVTIDNSEFTGNISGNGGSTFSTGCNASGKYGGDGGAVSTINSLIHMSNSVISGNQAGNGGNGGEYYGGGGGKGGSGGGIDISSPVGNNFFVSCLITENIAGNGGLYKEYYPDAHGGNGGGIAYNDPSGWFPLDIINSDLSLNSAGFAKIPDGADEVNKYTHGGSGGGIYCPGGGVSLVNVSCTGNKAGSAYYSEIPEPDSALFFESVRGYGGGMYDTTGTGSIMNSLFAFNKIFTGSIPAENDLEGSFIINYSLVKDNNGFTFSGNNNLLNVDPLFFDFPDSRLLTEGSPAVDAGNPDTSFLYLPAVDLTGNPRIINGIIDLGAYEYSPGTGYDGEWVQSSKCKVQSMPNPFRNNTVIEYVLPEDARVVLGIYDQLGQVVDILSDSFQPKGKHKVLWDAQEFEPGVYLYRLTCVPTKKSVIQEVTGKLILIR